MRALVIEDDKLYLMFVCKTLEKHGWQVDAAGNGRAALALMQGRSYDLVVTDILMPEYDGMETIMRLASAFPHTRILAMSGGAQAGVDVLEFARKLGADGYIAKPFLPNTLMTQVLALIPGSAVIAKGRNPG
jgi:DNA-binding response OmpR family regulator